MKSVFYQQLWVYVCTKGSWKIFTRSNSCSTSFPQCYCLSTRWQQIPWSKLRTIFPWTQEAFFNFKMLLCLLYFLYKCFYYQRLLLQSVPTLNGINSVILICIFWPNDWCKIIKHIFEKVLFFLCIIFLFSWSFQEAQGKPSMLHSCFCWRCKHFSYTCSSSFQQSVWMINVLHCAALG